jgi:hypothetical protein
LPRSQSGFLAQSPGSDISVGIRLFSHKCIQFFNVNLDSFSEAALPDGILGDHFTTAVTVTTDSAVPPRVIFKKFHNPIILPRNFRHILALVQEMVSFSAQFQISENIS